MPPFPGGLIQEPLRALRALLHAILPAPARLFSFRLLQVYTKILPSFTSEDYLCQCVDCFDYIAELGRLRIRFLRES